MRAASCALAGLLSAIAYSQIGRSFIAGGSDSLMAVARPSGWAVAAVRSA